MHAHTTASPLRPGGLMLALVLTSILLATSAVPAAAQAAGDPMPIIVNGAPGAVIVIVTGCNIDVVRELGGATLFGSLSPSGPYVGVLPMRYRPGGEGEPSCPLFIVPGVPAGTYWVTVVYGLVGTEDVPVSAWRSVTVSGTCTRPPSPPVLLSEPTIIGSSLSVAFASPPDCGANEMVLDVGVTPFGPSMPPITVGSLAFSVPNVPPGTYYLRARSRNAYGTSKPSNVVPLRIPTCVGATDVTTPQRPINPVATVNGNLVTLSWSNTQNVLSTPTFYVIHIKAPNGMTLDNLVLPAQTSISAVLGAGTYQVGISSGNACGTRPADTDLIFTVP